MFPSFRFFPFFLSPFFLSFPALSLSSQRMAPSNNRALYRFQSCHGRCTTPLKNSLGGKKRVFFSLLYPPLSSRRKNLVYSVVQHRSIKTYELLLVKHVIINDNKVENNILERTFFYISLFILYSFGKGSIGCIKNFSAIRLQYKCCR